MHLFSSYPKFFVRLGFAEDNIWGSVLYTLFLGPILIGEPLLAFSPDRKPDPLHLPLLYTHISSAISS